MATIRIALIVIALAVAASDCSDPHGLNRQRGQKISPAEAYVASVMRGADDSPWHCRRSNDYFECEPIEDKEGNRPTWAQWSAGNERTLALAWSCGSHTAYEDDGTRDFECRPQLSKPATKFDDGTAPRFHCFGTNDEGDEEHVAFHCEPYWTLGSDERRKRGSGWFLWLGLQTDGQEREMLLAVANQIGDKESKQAEKKIRAIEAEMQALPSPEPTMSDAQEEEENASLLKEIEKEVETSAAVESSRRARSPKQIDEAVEAEKRAWEESK